MARSRSAAFSLRVSASLCSSVTTCPVLAERNAAPATPAAASSAENPPAYTTMAPASGMTALRSAVLPVPGAASPRLRDHRHQALEILPQPLERADLPHPVINAVLIRPCHDLRGTGDDLAAIASIDEDEPAAGPGLFRGEVHGVPAGGEQLPVMQVPGPGPAGALVADELRVDVPGEGAGDRAVGDQEPVDGGGELRDGQDVAARPGADVPYQAAPGAHQVEELRDGQGPGVGFLPEPHACGGADAGVDPVEAAGDGVVDGFVDDAVAPRFVVGAVVAAHLPGAVGGELPAGVGWLGFVEDPGPDVGCAEGDADFAAGVHGVGAVAGGLGQGARPVLGAARGGEAVSLAVGVPELAEGGGGARAPGGVQGDDLGPVHYPSVTV